MRHLMIFIFSLIISLPLVAQVNGSIRQPFSWPGGHEELMPDFVFAPFQGKRSIGVSDPGLRQDVAREQAVQRAVFLYALNQKNELKLLSDYFSMGYTQTNQLDNIDSKILTLAILEQKESTFAYTVVDEYVSSYGEVYVCIEVGDTYPDTYTLASKTEFVSCLNEQTYENREAKLIVTIKSDEGQFVKDSQFILKGNEFKQYGYSNFNNLKNSFITKSYRYQDKGMLDDNKKGYAMNNAFWSTLMQSMCDYVTTALYPVMTIQDVSEQYNSSEQRHFQRKKINCVTSLYPHIIGIRNNKATIEWIFNVQQ